MKTTKEITDEQLMSLTGQLTNAYWERDNALENIKTLDKQIEKLKQHISSKQELLNAVKAEEEKYNDPEANV